MKLWLNVALKLDPHTEDSSTYAVLADMVMEEGDQELLKSTIFSLIKDANKLFAVVTEMYPECCEEEVEYGSVTDNIQILTRIAVHIFEECDWCGGCQADPAEMDWRCRYCVSGINFKEYRKEVYAAGKS